MIHPLLEENEAKRLDIPLPLLFCFAMFSAWQTGVIYFSGETLSFDGGTSLPMAPGDLMPGVVAGYVLSIIWMIFLPRLIVWAQRFIVMAALLSALVFFLPLPSEFLGTAYYIHCFCSVFLIGFETAVITYLFREETAARFITLSYACAMLIVAILQNDAFPVPFPVFLIFMVLATALQLFFYFKLPSRVWPRYVKKNDGLVCPRYLFIGLFALGGIGFLMNLFGITIAETIPNGESIFYGALTAGLVLVFVLWKILGIPVLRIGSAAICIAALGFLLALLSLFFPAFALLVCIALGCGGIIWLFAPFFALIMAKLYPSRFIAPIMVGLSFGATLLHRVLLEAFRNKLQIMYAGYLLIAVGLAVLYLTLGPYLTYSFRRKPESSQPAPDTGKKPAQDVAESHADIESVLQSHAVERLTTQELRVSELSLRGYTYTEIAATMKLQPNTVKWYQKGLYSKLHIHSKRSLFALVQEFNAPKAEEKPKKPRRLLSI